MKIAELEAHYEVYSQSEQIIAALVNNRDFYSAFSVCLESFPHIVPAINYRKKRDITPEVPELLAFTTIYKYAPPLFEHSAIELLFEFIKSSRVLVQSERNFLDSLEDARKREQLAHMLWNYLEKHPGMMQCDIRKELGIEQEQAVDIIELWEKLGILHRHSVDRSYRLNFSTRRDMEVMGLCPNCGVQGKGRKELFFRAHSCKKCNNEGHYYIEYGSPQ
jgi:hypothetical protein